MKTLVLALLVSLLSTFSLAQDPVVVTARTDTTKLVTLTKLNAAVATLNASIANLQAQITALRFPAFTTVAGDSIWYLARDGKYHLTVPIQSRPGFFLADSGGVLVPRGFYVGSPSDSVLSVAALRAFLSISPSGLPAGFEVQTIPLVRQK
jgi:hypothetical protein